MDNLQDLQKFYLESLAPYTYSYQLTGNHIIVLHFYNENLCHLLGIKHVFGSKSYLGASGFDKIADNSLTVQTLKTHNKRAFSQYIKPRLQHFRKIPKILSDGQIKNFNKYICKKQTNIEADFVFYEEHASYILHLFLRKESGNIYSPISFIVKEATDPLERNYIDGQTPIRIISKDTTASR